MLAPQNGNMAEVYAEFWRIHDISGEVETAINEVVRRADPTHAEADEDDPQWFLIETYAGKDSSALRSLARRRFGVFQPMTQRRDRWKGHLIQGWQPAFPGWLFVRAWNITKMRRRILSAPDVKGILADPVSNRAHPIPDGFVDMLRAESEAYLDHAPRAYRRTHWAETANRHVNRQKKRRPRPGRRIYAKKAALLRMSTPPT